MKCKDNEIWIVITVSCGNVLKSFTIAEQLIRFNPNNKESRMTMSYEAIS